MACITERKRQGKESKWQAVIRMKGHPAIVHTFDTRAQAEKFSAEIESAQRKKDKSAAMALQKLRRQNPSRLPFLERRLDDIIKDYAYGAEDPETGVRPGEEVPKEILPTKVSTILAKRRSTPKHLDTLGALWGHLQTVLDNVGDVILADAKSAWVLNYIDKMSRKLTPRGKAYTVNTIGKHLRLMRAACKAAALRADVDNPQLYFTLKNSGKKVEKSRDRRLEPGEHEKIMSALHTTGLDGAVQTKRQWRCLYRLALETGARLQELVLAQWVEFSHESVWSIPADHTKKTKARTVSLSPRARRIVRVLRAMASKGSRFVFHAFGSVRSVSNGWAYRVKKAGIVGLTFHDLRHEATTRMVVHPNEIRFEIIQLMVGHDSAEMTAKYTHLRVKDYIGLFDDRARRS